MKDHNYAARAERVGVMAYLSGDANGDSILSAYPTGGVAIGTNGLMVSNIGLGAITGLTDNTAGTADNTLEAIADIATAGGATPTATQVNTAVNGALASIRNDFADLAAKVNEMLGKSARRFTLVSESNGTIDISITESGVKSMYLCLMMPDGGLVVSSVITFA
jgi:hypothetical protein